MTTEPVINSLLHLVIDREPDLEYRRRSRPAFGTKSDCADRIHHANNIAQLTNQSTSDICAVRKQNNIDPNRLLVLEIETANRGARDEIEKRINATVVGEKFERREVVNYLVSFDNFEKTSLPVGSRFRPAQKADITSSHKLHPTQVPQNLDHNTHIVVEVPIESPGVVNESIASWEQSKESFRVTVQFETIDSLRAFSSEINEYRIERRDSTLMPFGTRQDFFDAIEWIGPQSREDRMGRRLVDEGFPDNGEFAFDVDLWHPGTDAGKSFISSQLRNFCSENGGRVQDEMFTQSLMLVRIRGSAQLLNALLELDIVSQVNLPPKLDKAYEDIHRNDIVLGAIPRPTGDEPKVAIIDSGVLSGHPLLAGWVLDERDFGTSEPTPSDVNGHGTQVAGLVLYGDVGNCIREQKWVPTVQILSGKVLESDPFGNPVFPEGHRPERLVERAIRFFHQQYQCRIFNLSLGSKSDVYRSGARQFAWAHVLDSLAKELDVIIVISAGNTVPQPPQGSTSREAIQIAVRDELLNDESHRLINPATAALAITVGATASSDTMLRVPGAIGAPVGAPAPFTRVGPGYEAKATQRGVKPDFVATGGNYAWRSTIGRGSWGPDLYMGEPTTRLPQDGRFLTTVSGTSFAAPKIAHIAAHALGIAQSLLGGPPKANTIRALLGVASVDPPCGREWLLDNDASETWEKLRMVGYGNVSLDCVMVSSRNNVVLLAEDNLDLDNWHVYQVSVPPEFLNRAGSRGINVALAFDPPVRASRKEYIANTMWVEILKGLTHEQIIELKSNQAQGNSAVSIPSNHELDMQPSKQLLQWSTLQVRKKTWSRKVNLPLQEGEEAPILHILVGSQSRFPTGLAETQSYSLAIRFWHSDPSTEIYQHLSVNARLRQVSRTHIQTRG